MSSTFFTFVFNDLRVLSEHSPGKFDLRVPGRHDLSGLRLFRHLRLHVTFDAELVERISLVNSLVALTAMEIVFLRPFGHPLRSLGDLAART